MVKSNLRIVKKASHFLLTVWMIDQKLPTFSHAHLALQNVLIAFLLPGT